MNDTIREVTLWHIRDVLAEELGRAPTTGEVFDEYFDQGWADLEERDANESSDTGFQPAVNPRTGGSQ